MRLQTAQARHGTVQQAGTEIHLNLDHHKVGVTLGHMSEGCSVRGHVEGRHDVCWKRRLPRHVTCGLLMHLPTILAAMKPANRFEISLKVPRTGPQHVVE